MQIFTGPLDTTCQYFLSMITWCINNALTTAYLISSGCNVFLLFFVAGRCFTDNTNAQDLEQTWVVVSHGVGNWHLQKLLHSPTPGSSMELYGCENNYTICLPQFTWIMFQAKFLKFYILAMVYKKTWLLSSVPCGYYISPILVFSYW
jgi:hypothetical protein